MTEPHKSHNQTENSSENITNSSQSKYIQAYDAVKANSEIVAKIMSGNFANFVEKEEKINKSVKLFEEIDNYETRREDFAKRLKTEGISISSNNSSDTKWNSSYILSYWNAYGGTIIPDIILQENYSHFLNELNELAAEYENISQKNNLRWDKYIDNALPSLYGPSGFISAIQSKNVDFLKKMQFNKRIFIALFNDSNINSEELFSQEDIDFIKEKFQINFGKEDFEKCINEGRFGVLFSKNKIFDVEFSKIELAETFYEQTEIFIFLEYIIEKTEKIPEKFRKKCLQNTSLLFLEEIKETFWEFDEEEKNLIRAKIFNENQYIGKFLDILNAEEIIAIHKNSHYWNIEKIFTNISGEKRQEIFDFFAQRKTEDIDKNNTPDWLKIEKKWEWNDLSDNIIGYIEIAKQFHLKINFSLFQKWWYIRIQEILDNENIFINFDSRKLFEIEYSDFFEKFPELVNLIFEKSQNNTKIIAKLLAQWADNMNFLQNENDQNIYKKHFGEKRLQERLLNIQTHSNIYSFLEQPELIRENIKFFEIVEEMKKSGFSEKIFEYPFLFSQEEIKIKLKEFEFLKKYYEKMEFLDDFTIEYITSDPELRNNFLLCVSNPDFNNLSLARKKYIFSIFKYSIKNNEDISRIINIFDENNFWEMDINSIYQHFENLEEMIDFLKEKQQKENLLKKVRNSTDFLIKNIFRDSLEKIIKNNSEELSDAIEKINNLHRNHHHEVLISVAENFKYNRELQKQDFEEILESIKKSIVLFERLLDSPSTEVKKLAKNIFAEIIKLENPVEFIEKIEKIFLENRLPKAGYLFRIFHELYDDKKIAYEIEKSKSPYLQRLYQGENTDFLHATFFKDLLKTHIYSGERSIKNFLTEMSESKKILEKYENQENLSEEEIGKLHDISLTLASLYQNKWVNIADAIEDSGNFEENFENIQQSLGVKNFREIFEYFEKIFLSKIGFENSESALDFMKNHQNEINLRNKNFAEKGDFSLQASDMIKWFESNIYNFIASEGFVARDFLGTEGQSDATPFDIDLIRLAEDTDFNDAINHHIAKDYGDAMAVFKKSENFVETNTENKIPTYKSHTFELFKTEVLSEDHFGIRTAVPTSEVSFYVLKSPHPLAREEFFFQIAKSGRYIPVVDTDQNLIFSYEDFEKFQEKIFSGISEWSEKNYKISEHKTTNPEILSKIIQEIPDDNEIANVKNSLEKIFADIDEILAHYGIKKRKNGDKSKIGYEIQSTGSTSRNTFLSGTDATFDFDIVIKLDEKWFQKIEEIIADCREKFPSEKIEILHNSNGSVQLLHGEKDENGTKLEIDLLFSKFSENTTIDANKAIEQRLQNILETHGKEKYYEILANIRAAKRWAKEIEVYKKWSYGQGGLGGIGIEVWILSHGGSFEMAKKSFLAAAFDADGNLKNFSDFRADYPIFGAGENIKSAGSVENFVNNMTPQGYEKFANALKEL